MLLRAVLLLIAWVALSGPAAANYKRDSDHRAYGRNDCERHHHDWRVCRIDRRR